MIRHRIDGHWAGWFYDETYRENIDLIWPVDAKKITAFMKHRFGVDYSRDDEFGASVVELMNQAEFLQVFLPYIWMGNQTFFQRVREHNLLALPEHRA